MDLADDIPFEPNVDTTPFTINSEFLESGGDRLNYCQYATLGFAERPSVGWESGLIGTTITQSQADKFVWFRGLHVKDRQPKTKSKPKRKKKQELQSKLDFKKKSPMDSHLEFLRTMRARSERIDPDLWESKKDLALRIFDMVIENALTVSGSPRD